jgi:hypothetical protein
MANASVCGNPQQVTCAPSLRAAPIHNRNCNSLTHGVVPRRGHASVRYPVNDADVKLASSWLINSIAEQAEVVIPWATEYLFICRNV